MKPITQENDRFGFVGIGYMGRPIARRLLESGFKVTAYDRDHNKAEELIRCGGTVAQSVSELSSNCNVVLSCLPNDEAVLDIYGGSDGVFAHANRGLVVIDLSTVYPETSQQLSRLGSERGVAVLDVTISGSTPAAENGRGHSGERQRKALNNPTSSRAIACWGFLGLWKDARAFDRALARYSPGQILALSRRGNSRLGGESTRRPSCRLTPALHSEVT
jgi:NAD binding domain of 6-phosphogluconate dehydrogenase